MSGEPLSTILLPARFRLGLFLGEMTMDALQRLREEVLAANVGIFRAGLVTMHSGNASGINRELGRVVIKPSGMDYEKLTAEHMVVTDIEGKTVLTETVADQLKPSVDLPHHLYLYRHCAD